MELSSFIKNLFSKGVAEVNHQIIPFTESDLKESEQILSSFYQRDQLNMPFNAPAFSRKEAIWGGKFIYRAAQAIVIRSIKEKEIERYLKRFETAITPEIIYSVDLTFRYLPNLIKLASGISPDDALVKRLNEAAIQFPFSSVGIKFETELDHETIFNHSSLKQAYLDRIIDKKDLARVQKNNLEPLIDEVMGKHKKRILARIN